MGGSRSGRWGSSKPFAANLSRLDLADYPTEMTLNAARSRLLQLAIGDGETPPGIDYAPEGFTYTFKTSLAAVAR